MKRFISILLIFALCLAPALADDMVPNIYPGRVAPLDFDYIYAPVEALEGYVLARSGLWLKEAPDKNSENMVLVPAGTEFKLLALYANGSIRVRISLGEGFYTGYFTTDMNKIGISWYITSDPGGIIPEGKREGGGGGGRGFR